MFGANNATKTHKTTPKDSAGGGSASTSKYNTSISNRTPLSSFSSDVSDEPAITVAESALAISLPFERSAFQKRLFQDFKTGCLAAPSTNIKLTNHWMSLLVNNVQMLEIGHASLANGTGSSGRECFNDFLDECYDDDSVAKLCVFFDEKREDSGCLEGTFKTMDFELISAARLSKSLGFQVAAGNRYLIIDTSIATSDEDFDSDLIDFE